MGALCRIEAILAELVKQNPPASRAMGSFPVESATAGSNVGLPPNRACMMAAQMARNSGGEPPLLW